MRRLALSLPALSLLVGACDRGEARARQAALVPVFRGPAVVRGVYTNAFETSRLEPCGMGEAWWVDGANAVFATLAPALRAHDERPDSAGIGYAWVYVVFRGDTTARGTYGHMDAYDREFALRQVDSVAGAIPADCDVRAPAS